MLEGQFKWWEGLMLSHFFYKGDNDGRDIEREARHVRCDLEL